MSKTNRQQKNFNGNHKHLGILLDALEKEKIRLWNGWRLENPLELPDLKGINLVGENLVGINLTGADLSGADLSKANLSTAELSGVVLVGATLVETKFIHATIYGGGLGRANFRNADLDGATMNSATLSNATFTGAKIRGISRTGWKIENKKCDYVYLDQDCKMREPDEGIFDPGEFEKLYRYSPKVKHVRMRTNMSNNMTQNSVGVVEFWNIQKGFGYIVAEDENRFFTHHTALNESIESLHAGDRVWFYIQEGERGPKAVNVSLTPDYIPSINTFEIANFDAPELVVAVSDCTKELVQHLKANPMDLYQIHPKTFEELVAAIFKNEGFQTELIGSWNQADGGVDVIAVRKLVDGVILRTAIQCKRYKPERRISADPIRSLAGVLDRFRAHAGVVASTSYFTKLA